MSDVPSPRQSPVPPGVAEPIENERTGLHPATREFTRWVGWLSTLRAAGIVHVGIVVGTVLGWEKLAGMARAEGRAAAREQVVGLEPRVSSIELMRLELYDMRKEVRQVIEGQRTGVPVVLAPLLPPVVVPKDGGP